jgi:RNA polymerase sigma-70 factor, ECF subfamily
LPEALASCDIFSVSQMGTLAEAIFEAGRRVWPDVLLPLERVVQRAGDLGVDTMRPADRAADLFLAYACAEGDPRAIRHFERHMLSQIGQYVARFDLPAHVLDELRQQVRVKLLVGSAPGIAQYRGLGPLAAWLRVTVVRMALDLLRSTGATPSGSDIDLLELAASLDEGPERAVGRGLYRQPLVASLERALGQLDLRDKTLLRLAVLDGLSGEAIGAIYGVHRATVARWFVAIRARVLSTVRQELGLPRAPSPSEVRSLVSLLSDDIDISARRILGAASP